MNRQINYILQGFVLLLVIAGIVGLVHFLSSMDPIPDQSESATPMIASVATNSPVIAKDAPDMKNNGKLLFQNNCAACHAVNKELVGPPLKGAEDKVTDRKVLYAWIRNNQAVLRAGDPYYNGLYLRYNKTPMMAFPDLTDDQITAILQYIREASE